MSHITIKRSLSVSQRLWTLGLASALGILTMIGVGLHENRGITVSLKSAETLRKEVETVVGMRHANVIMVLAAMDTIVDKDEKKIHPDRIEIVRASGQTLRDGGPTLKALAASLGIPDVTSHFDGDLDALFKAIAVDLTELVEKGANDDAYNKIDDIIDASGNTMADMLTDMARKGGIAVRDQLDAANTLSTRSIYIQLAAGLLAMVTTLMMQIYHGNSLRRSIRSVCDSMQAILSGRYDNPVDMIDRGDEIGDMARATDVFRTSVMDKLDLEVRSEQSRTAMDSERRDRDQARKEDESAVKFAVDALAAGLNRLAAGDITTSIETPFRSDLERLRLDFNTTIAELETVVSEIRENSLSIQTYSQQMRTAAQDLAKRTEHQAASLEETSAALDEITARVRSSSEKANDAGTLVEGTRVTSERSGKVVGEAMSAMQRIEDASREIGNIINVIDEIAFQTNLLALNAGVEAARAGDAGKGFAVVAQEVRELAGRAAGAAKDIKILVNKSGVEVKNGVSLVAATGDVLRHIGEDVIQISDRVTSIVADSHEQTTGLAEINSAVNEMDQVTQQNAAMVEQTSAASHSLAQDADKLITAISRFKVRERNRDYYNSKVVNAPARPHASPARALVSKVAGAFDRNSAAMRAEPVRASDTWEEF